MSFWTVVAVASSVGKAYATLYSAAATKASMDAQADISALQFKEKRIEYKEQGVEALKETNKALGTIYFGSIWQKYLKLDIIRQNMGIFG